MGNGYPVACFGGRADVMDVIGAGGGVVHGGTYTATWWPSVPRARPFEYWLKRTPWPRVNRVGGQREVLGRVFTAAGIEHRFAGPDSMFGVHFGSNVPTNYRDWKATNSDLYTAFAWELIARGVMLEPDSGSPGSSVKPIEMWIWPG